MSSNDDPMAIASSFLLQSPPGEINDVLSGQSGFQASPPMRRSRPQASPNRPLISIHIFISFYYRTNLALDVRNIIADDAELEKGIAAALEEYNLTQFTTVEVPGQQHQVIICEDGRIDEGNSGSLPRFLDPRSKTSFSFNHADLVRRQKTREKHAPDLLSPPSRCPTRSRSKSTRRASHSGWS